MPLDDFIHTFNTWASQKIPFLFLVDFEMQKPLIFKISDIHTNEILYNINGYTNTHRPLWKKSDVIKILKKSPISLAEYKKKFDVVYRHLCFGDSYLTNLTTATQIELDHSFADIFYNCAAKYKLLYKDQFLVFSPETFVQIRDGKIFAYPMKGTIDASLPNARETILSDQKELAEHVTIVDLLRNDISQIASQVTVTKFRFVEEIKTNFKNILQVSSEIVGVLAPDYTAQMGSLLIKLLPAGSVSGAPKPKTLDIIKQAEQKARGYYTGVFGYFDGNILDSGVMIRYIEKQKTNFFYRSGGGITTQSLAESEYREIIDKIYVPLDNP